MNPLTRRIKNKRWALVKTEKFKSTIKVLMLKDETKKDLKKRIEKNSIWGTVEIIDIGVK